MAVRILILDDEPEILKHVGNLLTQAGYECVCTDDSYAALSILKCEPIDLVIQDCLRPDIDGLEMYEMMKASPDLRGIAVLFFSAAVGPEETAEMRSGYGDGHLRKPATPEEFLAAVASVLGDRGLDMPN